MPDIAELHDALSILATWGEPCTYTPKNGQARNITAVLDRSRQFADGDHRLTSQEQLVVFVLNDPDHETYGGIDKPQLGDLIQDARHEKDYSWNGEEQDSDSASWKLKFDRYMPHEIGGNLKR